MGEVRETQLVECACCGGERGWEVVTGYDPRDGSPLGYFETCPHCNGSGEEELTLVLIDQEDLDCE